MKRGSLHQIIGITMVMIGILLARTIPAVGAPTYQWSPMQRIPGFGDAGFSPYLIADRNRTVHAFNSQWVGLDMVIVYSQWRIGKGWTPPGIIMLPPRGQARITGAILDESGRMHVTFFAGDDLAADIYYTSAAAEDAGHAGAWSSPRVVGPGAITPTSGALASDGKGLLVIVYSGNLENLLGNALYVVHSTDGGETWSDPKELFVTETRTFWPWGIQMFMDRRERLHFVWSVVGVHGLGVAVLYASMDTRELHWNEPSSMAEAIGQGANTPSIIKYRGELIVIYHNDFPTTRWMQRSSDGGGTWTEPVRIFEDHVGSNGPASLVIDSGGTLRMFFGNRSGEQIHGMWQSIWEDDQWSSPEAIVSGPTYRDKPGGEGFDPSYATAVVCQGNVVLVTWRTDEGAGPNGIWYSYATLDAPELPVTPLPSPIPSVTATLSTTAASTKPSPQTGPANHFADPSEIIPARGPTTPIIAGVVPVVIFLTVVIAAVQFSRRFGNR